MKSELTAVEWKVAEVFVSPQKIFTLWLIHHGLCRKITDFRTHFGDEFPIDSTVLYLEQEGFIRRENDNLFLTEMGAYAVSSLTQNQGLESLESNIREDSESAKREPFQSQSQEPMEKSDTAYSFQPKTPESPQVKPTITIPSSTITVRTKEELSGAIAGNVASIVILGKLAETTNRTLVLQNSSKYILTALGVSLATIPLTGGLGVVAAAPIAALTGLGVPAIMAVAYIGFSLVLLLIRSYRRETFQRGAIDREAKLMLRKIH